MAFYIFMGYKLASHGQVRSAMSGSSRPDPDPSCVEVACESWDQFDQVFRRRLDSHHVFVPSARPPPTGTQLEFRFNIPDGTSISMPAQVVSSVPPAAMVSSIPAPSMRPSPSGRPGMYVEFGQLARAEEKRVRALLRALEREGQGAAAEGPSLSPPAPVPTPRDEPAASPSLQPHRRVILPRARSSMPARPDPLDEAEVRAELERELARLSRCDDLGVLGLEVTADDQTIRAAYLQLSKRFHPHRHARHGSDEIRRLATELYVVVQRAYARLSHSPRMPVHDAGAGRSIRAVRRDEADVGVTEAVRLMELARYPEAIRLLVDVLGTDPDKTSARLWLNLAGARHALAIDEPQAAAECYREVLALQPGHPEAMQQLSQAPPARPSLPQRALALSFFDRLLGKKE